jgi:3-oxoadipate enol-lactonase
MNIQSGYAEVNGTRLYYEVAGAGFPVVLIHGFCADTRIWDHQFEPLTRRYRVTRYDARGFGKSAVPTGEGYTHPDDLKALLDTLGIVQTHIIGQSMGGEIAIEFALAYPDATRSLVLVDAPVGGYQWSAEYNESWGPVGAAIAAGGFHKAIDALMAHPLHIPISEQQEAGTRLRQILTDYSGWHQANTDSWQRPDPPAIHQLNRIHVPTLVITAQRSLPDFHTIADMLAAEIPNARKYIVPGVGHVIPLEAPQQLIEITLGFLADL